MLALEDVITDIDKLQTWIISDQIIEGSGDEQPLLVLVAEVMDTRSRIDRISMEGDLTLQQAHFRNSRAAGVCSCFEKRLEAILLNVVCFAFFQALQKAKKTMDTIVVAQAVAVTPVQYNLVSDILIDLGVVAAELCIEVEKAVLEEVAVPDMTELLSMTHRRLEIDKHKDAIGFFRLVIAAKEDVKEYTAAKLMLHLLIKIQDRAYRAKKQHKKVKRLIQGETPGLTGYLRIEVSLTDDAKPHPAVYESQEHHEDDHDVQEDLRSEDEAIGESLDHRPVQDDIHTAIEDPCDDSCHEELKNECLDIERAIGCDMGELCDTVKPDDTEEGICQSPCEDGARHMCKPLPESVIHSVGFVFPAAKLIKKNRSRRLIKKAIAADCCLAERLLLSWDYGDPSATNLALDDHFFCRHDTPGLIHDLQCISAGQNICLAVVDKFECGVLRYDTLIDELSKIIVHQNL
jgi:hypothetical protein